VTYTGWVYLDGGPREGMYGPVVEIDVSIQLRFEVDPVACYRPVEPPARRMSLRGPVPMFEFCGRDGESNS
jgi:hypothetical protein